MLDDCGSDIRDIFADEAAEALTLIDSQLLLWRVDGLDVGARAELRRAFHTLKGCGNMVGAVEIATLAGAVEDLLARLTDGSLMFRADMPPLLGRAAKTMPVLLQAFLVDVPAAVDMQPLLLDFKQAAGVASPSQQQKSAPSPQSDALPSVSVDIKWYWAGGGFVAGALSAALLSLAL